MAASFASSSRPEPKTLVEDSSEEDDAKVSSSAASRRHSHYDTQRTGRRSRPVSGSSQYTSKSKGKRGSYQQPADFQNLDEITNHGPANDADPDSLEQARQAQTSPKTGLETKSQAHRDALRKRHSSQPAEKDQTGLDLPPPVQEGTAGPSQGATQKAPLLDDPEAGDADDDDDSSGAPSPYVSRRPEEYLRSQQREPPAAAPRWLTEIYTISYLIFFSLLGTLARLGMQWLTFYPGSPIVTPVIWANFAGCVLMGFLSEDQALFRDEWSTVAQGGEKPGHMTEMEATNKAERNKRKKIIPLYIGLAVGFCGSFTSFSSFARDSFLALSNDLPTPVNHPGDLASGSPTTTSAVPRPDGYSFEAWAAIVIATLALALGGLMVGAHIALALESLTPRIPKRLTRRFIDPLIVFLAWASWLGAVLLAIWPPDRPSGPSSHGSWANETWRGQALFALVFAPLGCLLRFYASLKLNGLVPSFPLGTFAVNMLGTAVEARRCRSRGSGGWWKGGLPGAAGGSGRVLRVLDDG
ncbi:hypothetical protein LTR35_000982 [Friedmanniomyces endolithicus]|uniref:Uncharacterized protein n=1 Tax=Friedmanniomyces endolithicus TaxID=329885 RepID=A0AAN6JGF7_9PEZI|nr:hypothetical protein LTS00_013140 [Friedmanniomyces endolithicus]KAK0292951.1 hypothetical protein LTR35_000982 [Friedmanniomyces endolithicus]KAK0323462.1 hypothetical protein LTR82_005822 [Friedmanniomyces endolithicus]KAK1017712.1 hypothetical protein LTR54_002371 [Friedmanniomyces endolithicus]